MKDERGAPVRRALHGMNIIPLLLGARYVTCGKPGCSRVRRAWDKKPLLHNGRKPR